MTAIEVINLAKGAGLNLSIALSGAISAKGSAKDIARFKPVIQQNKDEILNILQQEYKFKASKNWPGNFGDQAGIAKSVIEPCQHSPQDHKFELPVNQKQDNRAFVPVELSVAKVILYILFVSFLSFMSFIPFLKLIV